MPIAGERLRVVIHEPLSGVTNMAVDDVLLAGVGTRWAYTVRFYQWQRPTVSLGYAQRWREGFDTRAARRLGVDLVRRRTGGRAVLHDAAELTYSLVGPSGRGPFAGGVQETYRVVAGGLVTGLRRLGADVEMVRSRGRRERAEPGACFGARALYEITSAGRKLLGSAQRRERGRVLQHGSLPLARLSPGLWAALGATGRPALAASIGLYEAVGAWLPFRHVAAQLAHGIGERLGMDVRFSDLSCAERRAGRRGERRYLDPAHTFRR